MKKNSFECSFDVDPFGNTTVLVNVCKDGKSFRRKIDFLTFCKMINNNSIFITETSYFSHGLAPKGLISSFSDNEGGLGAIVHVKKGEHFFRFNNKNYMLPFPGLIFYFYIKDSIIKDKVCFAVADEEITSSSKLYVYPYGNVATSSGNICMGSIKLNFNQQHATYDMIMECIQRFFDSKTTVDYYKPGNSTMLNMQLEELVSHVKKLKVFPDEILVSSPVGTVSDLIKKYNKSKN